MKHSLMALLALGISLTGLAQQGERPNSAISRNLEIFNDIYKQLDLFYVDSLDADTVIGWGIRSMLRQVDPFTDYYPEDDDTQPPRVTWRAHANLLYSNWLNYFVYQNTPYDLSEIK